MAVGIEIAGKVKVHGLDAKSAQNLAARLNSVTEVTQTGWEATDTDRERFRNPAGNQSHLNYFARSIRLRLSGASKSPNRSVGDITSSLAIEKLFLGLKTICVALLGFSF